MLSSTYVQVAMQVENDHFRQELVCLKSRIENMLWQGEGAYDRLENLFQVVSYFRRKCCFRRVERHFLPELKKQAGQETGRIAGRDELHRFAVVLHASVCRLLCRQLSGGKDGSKLLKRHIREYCQTMTQMLDEEEALVFSLARERFSDENWIYLAGIFMQEEPDSERLYIVSEQDLPAYEQAYLAADRGIVPVPENGQSLSSVSEG